MATSGVHLIGSVPLADAEAVFRTVSEAVGPYLDRIPDGETGERSRWIWFSLGLIHHDDRAGDAARIEAARAFVKDFGVASECGWGRGDSKRVPGLLASHRAAIELIAKEGTAS